MDPQFLVYLLDIWIAYVDRGEHYFFPTATDPTRPALARKLRDLIAAWTPPELPAEITEAARALLRAEGHEKPPLGAATWDDFNFKLQRPLEEGMGWPETDLMMKEATPAEVEARNVERKKQIAEWLKGLGLR